MLQVTANDDAHNIKLQAFLSLSHQELSSALDQLPDVYPVAEILPLGNDVYMLPLSFNSDLDYLLRKSYASNSGKAIVKTVHFNATFYLEVRCCVSAGVKLLLCKIYRKLLSVYFRFISG